MKASSSVVFFARARISFGAPCAITLPSSIAASQSNRLASSMYAVATSTLIIGRRARIESISSQNCRRESGSTPVVGSSRTSRSGSCISEQQRLTFCFMPPESLKQKVSLCCSLMHDPDLHQRAAEADLLLHAPRELAAGHEAEG